MLLWDCNGYDQQIFGYDGDSGTIYLANSGDASKCGDITGGSLSAGTPIQVWDCNSCWNQAFQVTGPNGAAFAAGRSSSTVALRSRAGVGCPGDDPTPIPTPTPTPSPSPSPGSGCSTSSGWTNQYEGTNPLSIVPDGTRSKNYFLILGDWGRAGGPGHCQTQVANLMKKYVQGQKTAGKTCLFIAAVGDNFYWTGASGDWSTQWANVYGTTDSNSPLYGIPFLAVMGNHDHSVTDKFSACPGSGNYATVGG